MTIKDLQLPLFDYKIGIIGQFYTKVEVRSVQLNMIWTNLDVSMRNQCRKHNRECNTDKYVLLGFITLALFRRRTDEASRNRPTLYGYKYKYY